MTFLSLSAKPHKKKKTVFFLVTFRSNTNSVSVLIELCSA